MVSYLEVKKGRNLKSQHKPTAPAAKTWSPMEVQILEAARHLIAEEGYHNFSMRGIAQKSGIHLKSLQYYFRTKQDMLSSVVDYTIENYYFATYDKLFEEKGASTPQEQFALMLDHLLTDLSDPFTARLFPELWALASHDDDVAEALDNFYVRHISSIERMVAVLNPRLSGQEAAHRAALMAMMIEGLVLIIGHGKKKRPSYAKLRDAAKGMILRMVALPGDGASCTISRQSVRSKSNTRMREPPR